MTIIKKETRAMNTSSALEGDEEYDKEYVSRDKELVVPGTSKKQDNYKELDFC
jgi:hypothetical protein